MSICASTNDAEKSINIFESLENDGYLNNCIVYNGYMKALGSRKDYSHKAIEVFHQMISRNVVPDKMSIQFALKACSQLSDIKQANDILAIMK
jgi:pentatricopeptide repeat protein